MPREILNDGSWPHPSRLPLGAGWNGTCCATEPETTSGGLVDPLPIREFCNLGYATGCSNLPLNRDWDAVRFSIAGSSLEQVTLCYTCELDHTPVEHGTLIYDAVGKARGVESCDPRVRRLANSYLHAYQSRQRSAA